MHQLKPSTDYEVVTLTIAIKSLPNFETSDVLNEWLNNSIQENIIDDYSLHSMKDVEYRSTDGDPCEGELFSK